ncbi:hypothetical protein F4703DRAFT_1844291 [Phycomyces blakesleeanus]|uniref:Uncharacterized protein n=2 Tax=Phycomyces blakesleeanus TaxID=4837 RepID=A0A167QXK5_PHYB8|nr:hypothetical protein PHYBLDRAFT_137985 [Phycomyces blakesleeanus NRRL 1555(-)]OAD80430.1 hypothetical protein PHYBLDRAFT_137985 [Phycomyces blakesleeanus NRRL 1555(-)]|eukprot:XP_018298470.1 hypothetical protein PHYBLDRAFT_137985 [Phycomyces blakesleeanus NRRL 1555(-)]
MSLSIVQLPPLSRDRHAKHCTLPSLRSVCPDERPLPVRHHHNRTTSLPLRQQALSLDILVDAIDLDRRLENKYRQHCSHSHFRQALHSPYSASLFRKRIHSAPSRLSNPETCSTSSTCGTSTHWRVPLAEGEQSVCPEAAAAAIVQQHIARCLKR